MSNDELYYEVSYTMQEKDFLEINPLLREKIQIKTIEPKNYDYSECETWQQLKKETNKAFKKLKEHEFKIRQS